MRFGWLAALALAAACKAPLPEGPVCGLHSASAPVVSVDGQRTFGVGAKILATDKLEVEGWALLECFTGGIKTLHKETVKVADLREWKVEALSLPHRVLKAGKVEEVEELPRTVVARYTTNRFTPAGASPMNSTAAPTQGELFMAFFTPNGMETLGSGPSAEGPRKLPAPFARPRVPFIHAGDLGDGETQLKVTDDVVFAETDDLATAALVEGKTYKLGRAVRLLLPDGAEGKLLFPDGQKVKLEGPMDLRLK